MPEVGFVTVSERKSMGGRCMSFPSSQSEPRHLNPVRFFAVAVRLSITRTSAHVSYTSATRQDSLIRQYKKLFELEGIQWSFDVEVLDFMVDKAVEFKLGARGLRSICESILTDAMFELPSAKEEKFHLDLEYAEKKFNKSKMNLLKVA